MFKDIRAIIRFAVENAADLRQLAEEAKDVYDVALRLIKKFQDEADERDRLGAEPEALEAGELIQLILVLLPLIRELIDTFKKA